MITLVLGGARSGKSTFAESQSAPWSSPRYYIATWRRDLGADDEMEDRVRRHRERRGDDWTTVEAGADLAAALATCDGPVVIDCLSVWLGGVIYDSDDEVVDRLIGDVVDAVAGYSHDLMIVSNEVGQGVAPERPEDRRYRDHHGRMNQRMAAAADRVVLVTAGIPLALKGTL